MIFLTILCGLFATASSALDHAGARTLLDPVQPLLLPDGAEAKDPLAHLGGNGPWTIGNYHNALSLLCLAFN